MKWREWPGRIDRVQHALWFKVGATAVIAAIAIAIGATLAVSRMSEANRPRVDHDVVESLKPPEIPKDKKLTPEEAEEAESLKARYEGAQSTERLVNDILARKADPTAELMGIAVAAGLMISVVWLGVGLTCLGIGVGVTLIALPMHLLGTPRETEQNGVRVLEVAWANGQDAAKFVWGVGALTLSLFILLELLKLALGGPWAVLAIAKNVVSEAIRMRVSIVLIMLLILGLTVLPRFLDEAAPLRYRVQTFLQYGTGATFWVIAMLVLFLSVATVAFEQRDKIIWQTMTKPVAAWEYLLGKWLGVVGIAAVLLAVTATGVFLFTGYLRNQKAGEEIAPFVASGKAISEDRLVLETQVLAARISARPEIPTLKLEDELKEVDSRMKRARASDPLFPDTDENRAKMLVELREELRTRYLSLQPGETRGFIFTGLEDVKKQNRPMTLRYKVSVGADDPRGTARVSFQLPNASPRVQEVPLGQALTIPISPASIDWQQPEPDANGRIAPGAKAQAILPVVITNGDLYMRMQNPSPDVQKGEPDWKNPDVMTIPPDGLEISYAVGGYEGNFLRVMIVLWLKLAFLAMVGVTSSTFLSFAVAALIAFGTFVIAESAGFLSTSLEYFNADDGKGNVNYFVMLIRAIALPIAWAGKFYADLKPTVNLVDGRMMDWTTVGLAMVSLGMITAGLYAIGVFIFKNRELATYSGQ
jgi:ABC-type transport system involved in multi-copper enzyme maturation permease subunit